MYPLSEIHIKSYIKYLILCYIDFFQIEDVKSNQACNPAAHLPHCLFPLPLLPASRLVYVLVSDQSKQLKV